ncbi:MAG: alpha/beta fold hydrolase [Microbacteriaceae bacterium]
MGWRSWFSRKKGDLLHIADDSGSGPVVILIHGIASSSTTFSELVPLIVHKHRCISIDLLGFGESTAPDNATFTIEEHVEAVRATIASLGLRTPFELVGHSMGSLIAARYTAFNPDKVSKLILVSPPIYVTPTAIGDPLERATMGLYLKAYEYLRGNKGFTQRSAAFLARISPIKNVLEVSERNWNAFVLSLQNAIESQTAVSDIAAVRVPVEVVYGTLDPFIMTAGLRIVEQLRNVTVHRVDANDHLVRKRLAKVVAAAIG